MLLELNNKKIGKIYEDKLCNILKNEGYWVHLFAVSQAGQPCDIIAVRKNEAIFIDAKHCAGKRFPFKDIQSNQITCFEYNYSLGNICCGFAIWFDEIQEFRWLSYKKLWECLKDLKKSISYDELMSFKDAVEYDIRCCL